MSLCVVCCCGGRGCGCGGGGGGRWGGGGRGGGEGERLIEESGPKFPSRLLKTKPEKRNVRGNPGGVAILTCKSFVMLGEEGERQTEPSHNWFPPQCPSGELELNNFIR